jgi:hypothetical protein
VPRKIYRKRKGIEPSGRRASPSSADESGRLNDLVAEISTAFIRASLAEIDDEINRALERIALTLDLDRSTIAEFKEDGFAFFSHGWVRDAHHRVVGQSLDANSLLPWTKARMLAGDTVIMPSVDGLPEGAAVDRESYRRYGPKSNVMIPIKVDGVVLAAVGFGVIKHSRSWPPNIVRQLQRITDIFGYAFARKRAVNDILRLRSELNHVSRVNTIGVLAASMTHELNQPLAAIMNNAEAVQSMLQSANPDLAESRPRLRTSSRMIPAPAIRFGGCILYSGTMSLRNQSSSLTKWLVRSSG